MYRTLQVEFPYDQSPQMVQMACPICGQGGIPFGSDICRGCSARLSYSRTRDLLRPSFWSDILAPALGIVIVQLGVAWVAKTFVGANYQWIGSAVALLVALGAVVAYREKSKQLKEFAAHADPLKHHHTVSFSIQQRTRSATSTTVFFDSNGN